MQLVHIPRGGAAPRLLSTCTFLCFLLPPRPPTTPCVQGQRPRDLRNVLLVFEGPERRRCLGNAALDLGAS